MNSKNLIIRRSRTIWALLLLHLLVPWSLSFWRIKIHLSPTRIIFANGLQKKLVFSSFLSILSGSWTIDFSHGLLIFPLQVTSFFIRHVIMRPVASCQLFYNINHAQIEFFYSYICVKYFLFRKILWYEHNSFT